ncbi:hypothetical protein FNV43_RR24135 [Rhamnella rubrinervis]|uniref:Uncharacterized protein n=1 Tax=Rhamnella rubrinervis TaxID=2594499 RepID=A0A8K0GQG0_9ROSA|nr:hypothetical protein FNV43_RR24135 [Rhamnella rubrinervis]
MDYERIRVGKSVDAPGTKPPFVDIHILLVDDDATTLAIVSAMLRTMRYQVATVRNPVDALATLRMKKGLFDIVVTDLHMPYMNGFELQKKVDEEFKLPVIMMSADDKESVILKSLEGGVAYFMVKPVSPDDLKNVWQYAVAAKKGKSVIIEEIESVHGDDQPSSGDHHKTSNTEDKNSTTTTANIEEKVVRGRRDCKRKASYNNKSKDINQEGDEELNDDAPKKAKVVWTNSLHNRFLLAIRHISLERAVPKRILEFMNVPGLTRENVASHLQKDDDDRYTHQFPRQQQMITTSTTSPLMFQQGFTRNHNITSTTPNASNIGLFRLHENNLPKLGFGHSNFLSNNHAKIQQPIMLGVGVTNPKPWIYQSNNYPGFGTSNGVNNGKFIHGVNDHEHQNLTRPGLFSTRTNYNLGGTTASFTTPGTIKNMGTTFMGNNNLMANSGYHPSSNFAGGVQTNSNDGGVVGLDKPGFNINGISNGYGLVNGVGNDDNVNMVAPMGNNIKGSNIMGYVAQGDSSSYGFENANQNQELAFPNSINQKQQHHQYGMPNGEDHAQLYASQNDYFISDLFMSESNNLQAPFQPQGGDQGLVSNISDTSHQLAQLKASPNQPHNPHDLSHLVQQNASFQQSFGQQHQGSGDQVVDCELNDMYQDWDEFMDSLLNTKQYSSKDFETMISGRCAACKYLRRRCPSDCIFSPYFPSNNPQRFACVHRIYGASNVGKMLQQLPSNLRAEAAETLYFEAKCRIEDPVYGVVGIVSQLHQQIHSVESEVAKVKAEIAFINSSDSNLNAQDYDQTQLLPHHHHHVDMESNVPNMNFFNGQSNVAQSYSQAYTNWMV